MAKTKQVAPISAPVGIQFRKGQKTIHHLFKASVATMLKNLSWNKNEVILDRIEHAHHFHSVSSNGIPQPHTTAVGGHFHEVTWGIDDAGTPVAKCGPPMRKFEKPGKGGMTKTSIVPLKWKDANDDWITDNHIHEMVYLGSDELSAETIRATQASTVAAIQAMTPPSSEDFDVKTSDD